MGREKGKEMKRRSKKKKSIAEWIEYSLQHPEEFGEITPTDLDEDAFNKLLQAKCDQVETYDSPFGSIDYIPTPKSLYPTQKLGYKVKRKNGIIETYIFFTDGSIGIDKIEMAILNKGDKIIDGI